MCTLVIFPLYKAVMVSKCWAGGLILMTQGWTKGGDKGAREGRVTSWGRNDGVLKEHGGLCEKGGRCWGDPERREFRKLVRTIRREGARP